MPKKLLFLIFFISISYNSLAQISSYPRINIFVVSSLENNYHLINLNNDEVYRTNTNFNVGADILIYQHKTPLKFGVGFFYQLPTNLIGQEGNYTFFPFYAFARFDILNTEFVIPTVQLELGYNAFSCDDNFLESSAELKGGLYYSIGSVLLLKKNFQIRIFYSVNYGEYTMETNSYLIKNNQLTFGLGWGF